MLGLKLEKIVERCHTHCLMRWGWAVGLGAGPIYILKGEVWWVRREGTGWEARGGGKSEERQEIRGVV